jgi:hypothetical protein
MRHWQAKVRPHWIDIVLAAALVVVGVGQVCLYVRQAGIMNTQAQISERQLAEMQLEGRAWVSVEPAIGNVVWDKDGVTINLKFTIKNTGNVPAMHVEMRDNVVPSIAPESPFSVLKRMTNAERQVPKGNSAGVPLFPKDTLQLVGRVNFSRVDITKNVQYLSTFRHNASDKPTFRPEDFKVALTLLYFVDYTFAAGDAHHQHSCMSSIVRVDPNKQIDFGVALPLDVNLSPPNVRLSSLPFGCEAD